MYEIQGDEGDKNSNHALDAFLTEIIVQISQLSSTWVHAAKKNENYQLFWIKELLKNSNLPITACTSFYTHANTHIISWDARRGSLYSIL
jgi:hypothetical protein